MNWIGPTCSTGEIMDRTTENSPIPPSSVHPSRIFGRLPDNRINPAAINGMSTAQTGR